MKLFKRNEDEYWKARLKVESDWLSAEYERLFGEQVVVEPGTSMTIVHSMQARIFRYYIEKIKDYA
jgi:hypothetical protein